MVLLLLLKSVSQSVTTMAAVSPESVDVPLLKDEIGGLSWEEGIATITFYKGVVDFKATSEALRAQLALVVEANPWLAGRLVKSPAKTWCLRHPIKPSPVDIDLLFVATAGEDKAAFKLKPSTSYMKICTDMYASKKVIVGNGGATFGKDKPLTLLTLSESEPGTFALIFSISHVIADGRTYYEIFQMLQPGASVRELSPTRVMEFSEAMKDMCGRKPLAWIEGGSAMCMYMPMLMGCTKKAKCYAFHLDAEKIAAIKAEAAAAEAAPDSEVPYVSTNDIITSGFFTECGSRVGMMGMDMRGRLPGIKEELAGNYVTALVIDPSKFGTPGKLRKMLSSQPYETTGGPLPSCMRVCCGMEKGNIAMVTNWSSFAGSLINLEGCEHDIHLPVQNPANCIFDLMIPFMSGTDGKKGVIIWTISTDEAGLRASLPVGDSISQELFP